MISVSVTLYLIGDGPMFCKILRIVFTLFFSSFYWAPSTLFLWGSAAEPCFLFLLGSQYPVSLGPWLQLDKKSLAVATAVALLFDEPTTVKSSC